MSVRATFDRAATAALLVCGGAAAVGCSVTDVVVAQEAPGQDADVDAADAAEASMPGCATTKDCGPGAYCSKGSCDAPTGTCVVRPLDCKDGGESQECGCDGVEYWNDCLRRRDGAESYVPGFCQDHFAPCGDPHDPPCPDFDAVCGRVEFGGACDMRGTCWVLPDTCPADGGALHFVPCSDPPMMPMQPATCVDLCTAVRSQQPSVRAIPGTCE